MPLLPVLLAARLAMPAASPVSAAPAALADSLMAPGVSRALADYRRRRVRDVRYDLSLDVSTRDTVRGHVTVTFTRTAAGDAILDWRGLALGDTRVNGREARLVGNGAHVRVPAALLRAGANRVELDFAAAIAAAGTSIIRFHDTSDGADYLYTLLVPADANALFPCFDQPD